MRKHRTSTFDVINVTILSLIALVCVYPFWNMLMVSISDARSVLAGEIYFLPRGLTVDTYEYIFTNERLGIARSVYNSVFYTVFGGLFAVLLTYFTAYALSRKKLVGRRLIMVAFVFTWVFEAGLIPNYLVLSSLGFVNSRWVMIIPQAISTFLLIITRSFLEAIPSELEESAYIDGANDFQIMTQIFLPLSKPVVATISVFYAIQIWNNFLLPLIYIREQALKPIQLVLYELVIQPSTEGAGLETIMTDTLAVVPKNIEAAAIVLGMVPIMLVYPVAQRHFTRGIMIGAIKG